MLYIFLRNEHSIEAWQDWLSKITNPQPLNSWQEAYKSQFGLAKLHNTRQFLLEVQSLLSTTENPFLQNMLPDVQQALTVIR